MTTSAAANAPLASDAVRPSRALHIGLWVAQGLLALGFLGAGGMKLATPIEELAKNMSFVSQVPPALVRFIGLSEVAGALGLVLPAATRIQPKLTPIAAAALVVVMVLAAATHIALGEAGAIGGSLVFGALAAFVAWGRWKKAPIAPRA